MWTSSKKVYFILYNLLGRFWFESAKFKPGMFFRVFWARRIATFIGKNVNIEKGAYFTPELSIGTNSGVGIDCELHGQITIGDNVMMAPEVVIYTRGHETSDINKPMISQGNGLKQSVTIGDDVWIGRRVMIMPGVCIGDGVIIGAGTVVTKNIESFAVVAGNPGRIVKRRN